MAVNRRILELGMMHLAAPSDAAAAGTGVSAASRAAAVSDRLRSLVSTSES